MADLPSQWTHEPSAVLRFRPGDTVAGIDTGATPGFAGSKAEAAAIASARNERFAGLQELLYANGRQGDRRSVLLVLQGMDTAGKGGIVENVVGAGSPILRRQRHISTTSWGSMRSSRGTRKRLQGFRSSTRTP